MKNFSMTSLMIVVVFLAGCAMKTKVLDATAISMTRLNLKPGEKLQETGSVTGKFCSDTFGDKGNIGLLDESVKSAQEQNHIDYIMNASFWREGSCISVEGTGAKVVAGMSTASPQATDSTPAPVKPAKRKSKNH